MSENQNRWNESCWGNNESTNTMRLQLHSLSDAFERIEIVVCDAGVFPQQPSFCSQREASPKISWGKTEPH